MKPEQQRICIAKACGWSMIKTTLETSERFGVAGTLIGVKGGRSLHDKIPDFLNDLNAMFEAEKIFDENQQDTYWCQLRHIVDAGLDDMQHCFNTAHATAEQRAKAFLFAIGKWVEP